MKILVTGATGQLGHDVIKIGYQLGMDIFGLGSKDLDITNKTATHKYIEFTQPKVIIHCAAYTAVDKAEDNKKDCWNVNVEGTKNIVEAALKVNAKLIYISTDYVFDGAGESPFDEKDKPNPIGYYGLTKYKGEQIIQKLMKKFFIVRISWVFGSNGNNFITTMLKLAKEHKELRVVGDQIGSPTYTIDLASLLFEMIKSDKYGIYHASNEGFCSWAEFATEVFKQTNQAIKVTEITTEEFPTRAIRPKNSRLSKQKIQDSEFQRLPYWKDAVARYLKEVNMIGE